MRCIVSPQNSNTEVLTPSTAKCDVILEIADLIT